jgi:Domain of unknown function (DUF5753)
VRFLFDVPNVRIGFIPNRATLPRVVQNSFDVYDSSVAVIETLTGEVSTKDEGDIDIFNTTFDELASSAVTGEEAAVFLDECKQFFGEPTWPLPSPHSRVESCLEFLLVFPNRILQNFSENFRLGLRSDNPR